MALELKQIAHICSPFPTKFGIPRQSGLVDALRATVVFEPEFRNADALRGLEGFSHLWLIWEFSEARRDGWSPTVRPPRLGGNARMGVFATRSPFRPNPLGLSCVRLEAIRHDAALGAVLDVSGADLMDGTPIYDVKPYLPEAVGGFAASGEGRLLTVRADETLLAGLPARTREALLGVLAHDPRPSYQNDPDRVYGMAFGGCEVHFSVDGETLTVRSVAPSR